MNSHLLTGFATASTTTSTSTITATPEKNTLCNEVAVTPKSKHRASAPVMVSVEKSKKNVPALVSQTQDGKLPVIDSPYKTSRAVTLTPRSVAIMNADSPRQSPRPKRVFEDEFIPSSRQRIEKRMAIAINHSETMKSTPRRDPSSRSSAPPKMIATMDIDRSEQKLNELAAEFARAWIKALMMAASKPKGNAAKSDSTNLSLQTGNAKLTEDLIRSISRSECKLKKSELNPDLLAMLASNNEKDFVTHTEVLKALFGQALRESIAGKTLLTMKRVAMEKNPVYAELSLRSNPGDEFKQAAIADMLGEASAAVDISFGMGKRSLASSKLPALLIHCWKLMDHELVEWAKENPSLPAELIQTARSNLGIDTIITRMIYPLIYGSPHEAHLLAPGWYATAVRSQLIAAWPEFFADFVMQTKTVNEISNEKTG